MCITTSGSASAYMAGDGGDGITTGQDGTLWFAEAQTNANTIGRVTA